MGSGGLGFMCNPPAADFAEWRLEQIEAAVRPTDAQRAALNELRAASTKAAETPPPVRVKGVAVLTMHLPHIRRAHRGPRQSPDDAALRDGAASAVALYMGLGTAGGRMRARGRRGLS
jgi:hypothetical protein